MKTKKTIKVNANVAKVLDRVIKEKATKRAAIKASGVQDISNLTPVG